TCAMLSAQTKDVDGWDKIKWGITVAEAQAAYGRDIHTWHDEYPNELPAKVTGFRDQLVLNHLAISGVKMQATIQTLIGSESITQVRLRLEDGSKESAYQVLGSFLRSQYGVPTDVANEEVGAWKQHFIRWRFPSTAIRLYWLEGVPSSGTLDDGSTL